jgi:catechol 2,3-dioxygenase-like lactoylglutathione lyase family enzyme
VPEPSPQVSIQLVVEHLGATEAFYGGILGVALKRSVTAPGGPEHLFLRHGNVEVVFVEHHAVVREHPVLEERLGGFPKGVGMTIHIQLEGIEESYDSVLDEGLQVLYPLGERFYGLKDFWCFDPDGYLVVVEEKSRKEQAAGGVS